MHTTVIQYGICGPAFSQQVHQPSIVVVRDIIQTLGLWILGITVLGLFLHYLILRLVNSGSETPGSGEERSRNDLGHYWKSTRILHWVHIGFYFILLLTGLVEFISSGTAPAQSSWLRSVHLLVAAGFIAIPFIYLFLNIKAALGSIKEAFLWNTEDMKWLMALPQHYLSPKEIRPPPQGRLNALQKIWLVLVILFGAILVISGVTMFVLSFNIISNLYLWAIVFHDVSFIVLTSMLFLHIYLSVIQPLPHTRKNEFQEDM